jgi:protein-L-isoaspartate(D-aspartate) O-methyltransferase
MMQFLGIKSGDRVLEIGTGSGYQTAILSLLAKEVYSIERLERLSCSAEKVLKSLRTGRIKLKVGDGSAGWPFYAPFDRIIVSALMKEKPDRLIEQLADGGALIAPMLYKEEQLVLFQKKDSNIEKKYLSRCAFVPLLKGVE